MKLRVKRNAAVLLREFARRGYIEVKYASISVRDARALSAKISP